MDGGRCRFGVSWRAGGWNMVACGQRRSRRPTCINLASLRFIHRDDMAAEVMGAYLNQVEDVQ